METIRGACEFVAAHGVTPENAVDFGDREPATIDIDNDGKPDQVRIGCSGSSCAKHIVVNGGTFSVLDVLAVASQRAWSHLIGAGVRDEWMVFSHGGWTWMAYYNNGLSDYPDYVAVMIGEGHAQPVCEFSTLAPPPPLLPIERRSDAPAICSSIETAKRTLVPDLSVVRWSEFWFEGLDIYTRGTVAVDFMNDGRPRNLEEAAYAFGGGRGCDTRFYRLAAADDDPDAAAILKRLQSDPHYGRGPEVAINGVFTCSGNAPRFHLVGDVVVFEQRFPDPLGAKNNMHEFWRVSRVEDGRVVKLCEAGPFEPVTTIVKFFPIER